MCGAKEAQFVRCSADTNTKCEGEARAELAFPIINRLKHGLRTPREEIAFTARPKIHSHSQIFRYGGSIFCLPHRPIFSDILDLCLHWVSVVRGLRYDHVEKKFLRCLSRDHLISFWFSVAQSYDATTEILPF